MTRLSLRRAAALLALVLTAPALVLGSATLPAQATSPATSARASTTSVEGFVDLEHRGDYVRPGFTLALCRQECFDAKGNIVPARTGAAGVPFVTTVAAGVSDFRVDTTGAAELPAGTYRAAVRFGAGKGWGYLLVPAKISADDLLTPTFSRGTAWQVRSGVVNKVWADLVVGHKPGIRTDVGIIQWRGVNYGAGTYIESVLIGVWDATRTTKVRFTVHGCQGKVVKTKTVRKPKRKNYRLTLPLPADKVGGRFRIRVVTTQKGLPREVVTWGPYTAKQRGWKANCSGMKKAKKAKKARAGR
ncbi:hypothetical protein KG112_03580 [Nocardioides sp. zg-ZUI104]|uniref:hypothetical protein n=1 Tax=Nocardioides faecalis TaxID=2803858 RepID=UPI001BCF07EF|nr:hypothetical protein [Nocardioides faecalis]MBS4751888.1 hypothetical protein [Nocardioides faecalis]